ncbi:hypothetical protein B0H14DRAFT_444269 [Mycena olivaceomarginata]|nr:hypothetical protein B0H14DRAFT_444269 [Mycena olivaceomarginata]
MDEERIWSCAPGIPAWLLHVLVLLMVNSTAELRCEDWDIFGPDAGECAGNRDFLEGNYERRATIPTATQSLVLPYFFPSRRSPHFHFHVGSFSCPNFTILLTSLPTYFVLVPSAPSFTRSSAAALDVFPSLPSLLPRCRFAPPIYLCSHLPIPGTVTFGTFAQQTTHAHDDVLPSHGKRRRHTLHNISRREGREDLATGMARLSTPGADASTPTPLSPTPCSLNLHGMCRATSARRATLAGVWDPHCRVPAFAIPRQEHANFVGVGAGSWTRYSHPQTHTHMAQRATGTTYHPLQIRLFRRLPIPPMPTQTTSSCSSLTFFMCSAVRVLRERRVPAHQPLPLLPPPSHAPIPFHHVYRAHWENEKAISVYSEEVEEEQQEEEERRGTRPRVSCSIVNYLLYLCNFGDSS